MPTDPIFFVLLVNQKINLVSPYKPVSYKKKLVIQCFWMAWGKCKKKWSSGFAFLGQHNFYSEPLQTCQHNTKNVYLFFLMLYEPLKLSHRRCAAKKGVLNNFTKFTGKHLCESFFFRPGTLLKKRLCHRCFPVSFEKFLRTPFFTEHFRRTASDQNNPRWQFFN